MVTLHLNDGVEFGFKFHLNVYITRNKLLWNYTYTEVSMSCWRKSEGSEIIDAIQYE